MLPHTFLIPSSIFNCLAIVMFQLLHVSNNYQTTDINVFRLLEELTDAT